MFERKVHLTDWMYTFVSDLPFRLKIFVCKIRYFQFIEILFTNPYDFSRNSLLLCLRNIIFPDIPHLFIYLKLNKYYFVS